VKKNILRIQILDLAHWKKALNKGCDKNLIVVKWEVGSRISKEVTSVAVDHSLTFCCVKTSSNTHWIGRIVYEFSVGGVVLFVFTQLISFRFSIQWIVTTDPWLRGNLLDAVSKFRRIIIDSTGTNPSYTETEKSSTVSFNALDRTENIYRGYYMVARGHEISLLMLKLFHEWEQRTNNIAETCLCSLHCSDKGKIYCHPGNANFSRVKVSSIRGKAHLIRYFSINLFFASVVH